MLFSEKSVPFGRGTLKVCRRGRSILLVALYRPSLFNAFNDDGKQRVHADVYAKMAIATTPSYFCFVLLPAVYEDLIAIMNLVEHDISLSAIVLTGSGSYFSSGADLKNGNFTPERVGRKTRFKPAGRFMLALIRFPKILAAAVNGPAVGIAVTLLLHCDLVHCSDKAILWAPFTRLALVPELCSSQTFIESHGLSKANEMLLLGKKICALTAMDWNICSKVVKSHGTTSPDDPFMPDSLGSQMCKEIDRKLLSLPLGDKTAHYFVHFIKGARRERMEKVCLAELDKLDERFDTGQVQEAASNIRIGSKAGKQRSKL